MGNLLKRHFLDFQNALRSKDTPPAYKSSKELFDRINNSPSKKELSNFQHFLKKSKRTSRRRGEILKLVQSKIEQLDSIEIF